MTEDKLFGMLIGGTIGLFFWFLIGLTTIILWYLTAGDMSDSAYATLFLGYLPCAFTGAYVGWKAA